MSRSYKRADLGEIKQHNDNEKRRKGRKRRREEKIKAEKKIKKRKSCSQLKLLENRTFLVRK